MPPAVKSTPPPSLADQCVTFASHHAASVAIGLLAVVMGLHAMESSLWVLAHVKGIAMFNLCLLLDMAMRQALLRILMRGAAATTSDKQDKHDQEQLFVRTLLLLFPSAKEADGIFWNWAEGCVTNTLALVQGKKAPAAAEAAATPKPPSMTRQMTTGAGTLSEAVECISLGDDETATGGSPLRRGSGAEKKFRSALYVSAPLAASIALRKPRAIMLRIISLIIATSAMLEVCGGVPLETPTTTASVLRVALLLRLLVPLDASLNWVLSDLLTAREVSQHVRHGFWYLAVVVRIVAWAAAATSALALSGFDVSSMITAWGFAGFAVTLSLQQVIKDLFNTFRLFLNRPFDEGDEINLGGGLGNGIVKAVDLTHTTVAMLNSNQELLVPNVQIADGKVENYSRMEGRRRGMIEIVVAVTTPVAQLRAVPTLMRRACEAAGLTVNWCHMDGVTAQGARFLACIAGDANWTAFSNARQDATLTILQALGLLGVELPTGTLSTPTKLTPYLDAVDVDKAVEAAVAAVATVSPAAPPKPKLKSQGSTDQKQRATHSECQSDLETVTE